MENLKSERNTSVCDESVDLTNSEPILNNLNDIEDFCRRLEECSDFRKTTRAVLVQHSGRKLRNTVKFVLKKIFRTEDMAKINRHGTDGKVKLIGPIDDMVKEVARSVHHDATVEDTEKAIAAALKIAANKKTC